MSGTIEHSIRLNAEGKLHMGDILEAFDDEISLKSGQAMLLRTRNDIRGNVNEHMPWMGLLEVFSYTMVLGVSQALMFPLVMQLGWWLEFEIWRESWPKAGTTLEQKDCVHLALSFNAPHLQSNYQKTRIVAKYVEAAAQHFGASVPPKKAWLGANCISLQLDVGTLGSKHLMFGCMGSIGDELAYTPPKAFLHACLCLCVLITSLKKHTKTQPHEQPVI